jgi:hypothetical protein
MFTIGLQTWEGFDAWETAETLEKAIAIAEKLYKEEDGDKFTSEESIEVWCKSERVYTACGE